MGWGRGGGGSVDVCDDEFLSLQDDFDGDRFMVAVCRLNSQHSQVMTPTWTVGLSLRKMLYPRTKNLRVFSGKFLECRLC